MQYLADLLAAAENRAPHPVPRLDNHLALPDQFQVMVNDLLAASEVPAATLSAAARTITATAL